ncbi:alpha-ketoglutarate-dependent dioxygenase AlkB [Synechococcus sp. AH-601-N23]|nr:alpha-ketoglutarate-dependent dioxygenase AlkB [Synechococcus sp. AH-601-N23]
MEPVISTDEQSDEQSDWSLFPSWLSTDDAQRWLQLLEHNIAWEQPLVQVFGKYHRVPRKTVFVAEQGLQYRYSGAIHVGDGWPEWFLPLLEQVNHSAWAEFNGCLLNLYRDGDDRMGWHADDETEIDQTKPIASLSLGICRDFVFRERTEQRRTVSLALSDGDLLVMHPGCQQRWMHALPRRRKVLGARINLTFRCFQSR